MKIIVISDTHIPKRAKHLPENLIEELKKADYIIHAGDWQSIEVYEQIAKLGNVVGVTGNVDEESLRKILPTCRILEWEGVRIGLIHGDGKGKTTEKRALDAFIGEKVDIVIFGHSHIPYLRYMNGVLLFNPGSPTDKRKMPKYSYGILELIEGNFTASHVFFS